MAQIGLNMGPRHARVLGFAKSYSKKLDDATKILHDRDIVGAVSFIWALMHVVAPQEVTSHIEESMAKAGVPRLATQNVAEGASYNGILADDMLNILVGQGYTLSFSDKEFVFS